MIKGRIHSFESMGLLDGPGIRNVVFFQGCNLRCSYCHNPDTWKFNEGYESTPEELLSKILRYKSYFKNGGGVTFSGGEPLMQPEFLIQCLKLCNENNIHTVIDTSGCGYSHHKEILEYTDLVLLDIKHITDDDFKSLTGVNKKLLDDFIISLNESDTKVWIRHVVVPNLTDSEEHIMKLAQIIKTIKNVEKIELLPYHQLGQNKYDILKYDYKLKSTPAMDKDRCKELETILRTEVGV